MLQLPSSDIAFCFVVHKEFNLAIRLINQIRSYYLESDLICIMDGTCNIEFVHFCEQNQVICIEGESLYTQQLIGMWLERLLQTYLGRSNANFMVKLDPDSYLQRKFSGFPDTELGGSLSTFDHLPSILIQGGCRFHTREACIKILASNLLQHPQYAEKERFALATIQKPYADPRTVFNKVSRPGEDRFVSYIASALNLTISDWSEVYCRDSDHYCPDADRYAVIHPVKR